MGKIFRRTLTALLIVIFALSAAIVGAKIQMYTATGEDYANEIESQDIAKLRARDKAIKKATKQAGVYLKTYSRSVNSELTDDEVTAITSNAWQLVGEPKYSSKIVKGSDETSIIIWTATVEVNVDDSEFQSWIKRDDKEKSTIITQTREAQKASEENDRKIEDLREKYNHATSQAEKDSLRKQMNDADRDFLANQKLEEGNKLDYAENYNGAIKLYNEAIELNPNLVDAYYYRGTTYCFLLNQEAALDDFIKICEITPENACDYLVNVNEIFLDNDNALILWSKLIELNPNYAEAYYNRGCVSNNEQAIQDLNKAIELKPNYAESYLARAITYWNLKNYELALADYNKVIELEPTANNYEHRASFYEIELKDYENALKDYNKMIELDPSEGYWYRAQFYERFEDYNHAIQDLNKYIEINPTNSYPYTHRGKIYIKLQKYNEAITDYTKAIKLKPKDESYYRERAEIYKETKNYNAAIEDYKKAIEIAPYISTDYYRLLSLYKEINNYELAVKDYTEMIKKNMNDRYAYWCRGWIYIELQKYDEAIADYAKVIELDPKNSSAYLNRGVAYVRLKNYNKAIKDYTKAIELEPKYGLAYNNRGKCYQALGDEAKAKADFAKAKELGYNG